MVVRLKGGDPAVFGRLDEEVEALEAEGIPYGVVPGVTSASAAAAAIGQSLTRRGRNSSFRFVTGTTSTASPSTTGASWPSPAPTAAIYMGRQGRDLRARAAADARRGGGHRR